LEKCIETVKSCIETVEKIRIFFTPPAHLIEISASHEKRQKTSAFAKATADRRREIRHRLPKLTPGYVEELRRGRQIFLMDGFGDLGGNSKIKNQRAKLQSKNQRCKDMKTEVRKRLWGIRKRGKIG